jgi:hypothetical protein
MMQKPFISAISISLLLLSYFSLKAQPNYDKPYGRVRLKEDLEFFKRVRLLTNSGLYKYRNKTEIDSIFNWGMNQITDKTSLLDFYKIILTVTDFEGSVHNGDYLPQEVRDSIKKEVSFFPLPVKMIEGRLLVNTSYGLIPLGSQIIKINDVPIETIIKRLDKYYTTDGFNVTGKQFGLGSKFSINYRYEFGSQRKFIVEFAEPKSKELQKITLEAVPYNDHIEAYKKCHSSKFDSVVNYYDGMKKYSFAIVNPTTAHLRIRIFLIGYSAKDKEHKTYCQFLDSCFTYLRDHKEIKNLIIDPRGNPGGSDPNDQVTFSYLASRPFQENKSAFVSFHKIPEWKYVAYHAFFLKRWIAKGVYQRQLKKEFSIKKDGKYYQGKDEDNTPRMPNSLAFKGQIYLLLNPSVGSAASMFSAMVKGNTNAIAIGQETEGGYYGHNGHQPMGYDLPNTKILTGYSIVNLEQDVPVLEKQPFGRGIMPDHSVEQTYDDFLSNRDTQMEFLQRLIDSKDTNN